ncbi:MAG: ATP-dependent DNA helicase UvrD2 [Bacteroidia bacterium]|nr:ATP-dependent DNA helicase UvrD2 [Bacteroidia bacterium]
MQTEISPYQLAHDFASFTSRSVFITGKAGTGKTTFLRNLHNESSKSMAIVAPTGVSAIQAGGVTIHSFFQLPFHPFLPTVDGRRDLISKVHFVGSRRQIFKSLELLVIDEVSMVRADVLDAIDTILRHYKYCPNLPFGGVQVLFIGDLYQLSPVYKEEEKEILSPYYDGMYFFDSKVIKEFPPVYIELDKIFRQSDMNFIGLLNEVRNNILSQKNFELLESLYKPDFKPSSKEKFITLTTHNYKADTINSNKLKSLKSNISKFTAIIKGEFPEKSYPTEEVLELKVGARVMFLKNDRDRRFYNGKIGDVEGFDIEANTIMVRCSDSDDIIELQPDVWENVSYTMNKDTRDIKEKLLGTFTQFPLRLAWAITIHKSQGLTFDKAMIDADKAFAPGQVYVALSRCRSLDGIVLLSPINRKCLCLDSRVTDFGGNKQDFYIVSDELLHEKSNFILNLVSDLCGFRVAIGFFNRLSMQVTDNVSSFSADASQYLESIRIQLCDIQDVALKFQSILKKMLESAPINDYFQQRIRDASSYFYDKILLLLEELQKCNIYTSAWLLSLEFDEDYQNLFSELYLKSQIMNGVKEDGFSVEQYYALKATICIKMPKYRSYTSKPKKEAKSPRTTRKRKKKEV